MPKSCVSKFRGAQNCASKLRVTILLRDPLTIPVSSWHLVTATDHLTVYPQVRRATLGLLGPGAGRGTRGTAARRARPAWTRPAPPARTGCRCRAAAGPGKHSTPSNCRGISEMTFWSISILLPKYSSSKYANLAFNQNCSFRSVCTCTTFLLHIRM